MRPQLIGARETLAIASPAASTPGCASEQTAVFVFLPGKSTSGWACRPRSARLSPTNWTSPLNRIVLVMGDTAETPPDQGGVGGSTSIIRGRETIAQRSGHCTVLAAATGFANARRSARSARGEKRRRECENRSLEEHLLRRSGRWRGPERCAARFRRRLRIECRGLGEAEGSRHVLNRRAILSAHRSRAEDPRSRANASTDVRVPGMLHGRVIRPAGVGATLISVDEVRRQSRFPAT